MKAVRLLTLVGLPALAAPAAAIDNPLRLAPADSEFLVSINVRQALDTPAVDTLLAELGEQRIRNQAAVIQTLTDFDAFSDLDRISLYGRIDEDPANVIVAEGRFNQQKLVSLVALNATYEKQSLGGYDVHHWDDEDGEKYAVFLDAGTLVFGGSADALQRMNAARTSTTASFLSTPAARDLPADLDSRTAYGFLVRTPGIDCDFGDFARSIDLSHFFLEVRSAGDGMDTTLSIVPADPANTPLYLDAVEGGHAAARLLAPNNENAALMESLVTSVRSVDNNRVVVEGSADGDLIADLIRNRM